MGRVTRPDLHRLVSALVSNGCTTMRSGGSAASFFSRGATTKSRPIAPKGGKAQSCGHWRRCTRRRAKALVSFARGALARGGLTLPGVGAAARAGAPRPSAGASLAEELGVSRSCADCPLAAASVRDVGALRRGIALELTIDGEEIEPRIAC